MAKVCERRRFRSALGARGAQKRRQLHTLVQERRPRSRFGPPMSATLAFWTLEVLKVCERRRFSCLPDPWPVRGDPVNKPQVKGIHVLMMKPRAWKAAQAGPGLRLY